MLRLNYYQHTQTPNRFKKVNKEFILPFPLSGLLQSWYDPFKSHPQKPRTFRRTPPLFTTCSLAITSVSQVTVITFMDFILWMLMWFKRWCFWIHLNDTYIQGSYRPDDCCSKRNKLNITPEAHCRFMFGVYNLLEQKNRMYVFVF